MTFCNVKTTAVLWDTKIEVGGWGGSGGQHQIEQDLPHKDLELRRSGAGRNNGQFLKMNRKSFHTPDISICIWISGGGVVGGSQFLWKLAFAHDRPPFPHFLERHA